MIVGMAKRISTIRLLVILLLGCMAFSLFLDMKVVSSAHNNHSIKVREAKEPPASLSRHSTGLTPQKNGAIPKDTLTLKKIPQKVAQTASTDPSRKNRAKNNVTPSTEPLHPDTHRDLPRSAQNAMPPIQVVPSKRTDQKAPVQELHLQMPDDPEAYMKSHNAKIERLASKQGQLKKESIRQEEKRREAVFPKLFWMFNQLNRQTKNDSKNKSRIVFDLSAKAKKSGKIGPFTDKKRINKALKSIIETFHEEDLTESAQQTLAGHAVESSDNIGLGAPVQSQVNSPVEATTDVRNKSAKVESRKSVTKKSPPSFAAAKKALSRKTLKPLTKIKPKPKKPAGVVSHAIDHNELSLSEVEIEKLKIKIRELNKQQSISNTDIYGAVANNTLIILIQVHSRVQHLGQLIDSLSKARHINECLVVFSHDFWQPEINELVGNIKAFRAMQIFFPFSVQLHPHSFPGLDPRDCHWNHVSRKRYFKHIKICLNEDWPDSYGHYRETRFTQLKHHWWWKVHKVFDDLMVTRNFTGDVLFLEDDHYVSPDTIHTLRLLRTVADQHNAHVLSVGNFLTGMPSTNKKQAFLGDWGGTKYNLGFAFNSHTWKLIKAKASFFCTFDDYNWDWTLATLLTKQLNLKSAMLATKLSRVYHIGTSCGTHARPNTSCNLNEALKAAKRRIKMAEPYMFPASLELVSSQKNIVKQKKNNGGWGDLRDKQLCVAVANGTASENTLAALQFPEFVL